MQPNEPIEIFYFLAMFSAIVIVVIGLCALGSRRSEED